MSKLETILVPLDGSDPSMRALDFAAALAANSGATLDAVTVLDLKQVDFYEGFYLTEEQLEIVERKLHESILQRAIDHVGETDVKISTRVLKGQTLKLLLDEAERASHVVMGRTGKSAWERLVEGSVSRGMSAHCPVPVTIVP